MIIPVLKALRAVFQQSTICIQIINYVFCPVKLYRTFGIHFDFSVHFHIKPYFPFNLIFRSRYNMNLLKNFTRLKTKCILLLFTVIVNMLLRINTVHPRLNNICTFTAQTDFQRSAHRNIFFRQLFHNLMNFLSVSVFLLW